MFLDGICPGRGGARIHGISSRRHADFHDFRENLGFHPEPCVYHWNRHFSRVRLDKVYNMMMMVGFEDLFFDIFLDTLI